MGLAGRATAGDRERGESDTRVVLDCATLIFRLYPTAPPQLDTAKSTIDSLMYDNDLLTRRSAEFEALCKEAEAKLAKSVRPPRARC